MPGLVSLLCALPTQAYAELRRLEEQGLVAGEEVEQQRRPNKPVFEVTEEGREELERFARTEPRPTAIKDELMVQLQAADAGDMEAVAHWIDERRKAAEIRLAVFEALIKEFLRGRDEQTYLRTARRIGPTSRGHDFERENLDWCRWAADAPCRAPTAAGAAPAGGDGTRPISASAPSALRAWARAAAPPQRRAAAALREWELLREDALYRCEGIPALALVPVLLVPGAAAGDERL